MKRRIAVIGGGIFGATAALYAARAGYEVHLFEEKTALLQGASGINQFRLHRGYHYPRSPETARAALEGEKTFREEYGEAVIGEGRNFYAIARERSKTSGKQFINFAKKHGLTLRAADPANYVDPETVELFVEAEEAWYDPRRIRELIEEKLREAGARLHLATRANRKTAAGFDRVIQATYANLNALVPENSREHLYQYEVCEKPVVCLPASFRLTGIVVMDGPFMCVDPYGRTGNHVMGHVVHAIHATNTDFVPVVPENIRPLLHAGLITDPPVTAFPQFNEDGSRYIPILRKAEYVGSLFTIRTVLPNMDATDARPTTVSELADGTIRIFSGKVSNCVEAAKEAVRILSAD